MYMGSGVLGDEERKGRIMTCSDDNSYVRILCYMVYMYIYVYICIYLYIYIYIYLYIYIYVCVCVCVCVYRFIHLYMACPL